jgi:hypothetical protein
MKILNSENYDQGVALIHEAIQADGNEQYEEAYQHYTNGIELIMKYIHSESTSGGAENVQLLKQLETYLDRAEVMKEMRTHKPPAFSPPLPSAPVEAFSPSLHPLCVICLSNPSVFATIPCGHLILCQDCHATTSESSSSCFICRTELCSSKYLRIFTT